jgi:hypothetical protein
MNDETLEAKIAETTSDVGLCIRGALVNTKGRPAEDIIGDWDFREYLVLSPHTEGMEDYLAALLVEKQVRNLIRKAVG